MPHVEISCYPGKTKEQKKLLAEKIKQDFMEVFQINPGTLSVVIKEVEPSDWEHDVWNRKIANNKDFLYIKPNYNY